ncbi:hypothetical protein SAMN02745121_05911 [Nannocystis exedens]|uniref:Lipoprotein n=1 Tax=Nannocystis exedens TaxID=54 RepID=A0A1I2E5L3_9BACT|nr:hypothetical protein [Nannocystis exedens]PCC69268.1 hypothetical protein NAEX_02290 [Nannocystis exedens]SFE87560.1 hypothetical protein SAMN02745121_05911 [Nannocystis exedens]
MSWRPDTCGIFILVSFAACMRRPAPEPPPVQPVDEPLCAASLKLAHACTGAQSDLVMCSVFTASAATSEITNNTDRDLVFATGMMIVDGRGEELLPPVLGPEVRVPARSTTRPWQIAMPRLPDGYVRIEVMVLGTSADGGHEPSTSSEGLLRVRGGQIEVLEFHEWYEATASMNVYEALPGQPDVVLEGPTPGERLYEQLRAQAKRFATP